MSINANVRYFDRDVQCIVTFFYKRFAYRSNYIPRLHVDTKREVDLDKEIEASGFTKEMNTTFDTVSYLSSIFIIHQWLHKTYLLQLFEEQKKEEEGDEEEEGGDDNENSDEEEDNTPDEDDAEDEKEKEKIPKKVKGVKKEKAKDMEKEETEPDASIKKEQVDEATIGEKEEQDDEEEEEDEENEEAKRQAAIQRQKHMQKRVQTKIAQSERRKRNVKNQYKNRDKRALRNETKESMDCRY